MIRADKQPILHLVIEGRVQGVGFRYSTQQQASLLNLCGWVKNRRDGRVELVAQGAPEDVDAFLMWCRSGPRYAQVTRCVELSPPAAVELMSFVIKR